MVRPGENLTELYDLADDFAERHNLAEEAPRRVDTRARSLGHPRWRGMPWPTICPAVAATR